MSAGILISVILVLAACGYRYGFAAVLGRLVSMAGGYAGAVAVSHQVMQWLSVHSAWKGLDAWVLSAVLAFIAGYILAGIFYRAVLALFDDKHKEPVIASRFGGASLGAVLGIAIGGIAVWLGGMVQDVMSSRAVVDSVPVQWAEPDVVRQTTDRVAAHIAHDVIQLASNAGDATAQASSALLAQPVRASVGFRQLTHAPEFRAWLDDPQTQDMLAQGNIEQLMQTRSFRALTATPEHLDALRAMQGAASTTSGDVVTRQFAQTSATVWQKIQRVKSTPEFQRLLEDPEIARLGQEPDIATLLHSEKMRALVALVFSDAPASPALVAGNKHAIDSTEAQPESSVTARPTAVVAEDPSHPGVIYQWKDADGHIRFGDKLPPDARDSKKIQ